MQEAEMGDYFLRYKSINLDATNLALPSVTEYLTILSATLELLELNNELS